MDSGDSRRQKKRPLELVREIRPEEPGIRSSYATGPAVSPGGIGWKTVAVFLLVLGAGVAVFALLPSWVEEREQEPVPPRTTVAEADPPPPVIEEAPAEPQRPVPVAPAAPERPPPETAVPPEPQEDSDAGEKEFQKAMAQALKALGSKDYDSARAAFERARALRPEAPEIESGLVQVEEGVKAAAIARHRARAEELEARESFREAQVEYEAALALDPTLRFAREGSSRTAASALLSEKLDFHISRPERLTDERAHEEAARLLDEARGSGLEGEKHRERVRKLEELLASWSIPIEVELLSDGLTEVSLYRVGPLGKFQRRMVELRPGTYVVTGSRAGFRDVRLSFSLEPGKPLAPVRIRCEEKI